MTTSFFILTVLYHRLLDLSSLFYNIFLFLQAFIFACYDIIIALIYFFVNTIFTIFLISFIIIITIIKIAIIGKIYLIAIIKKSSKSKHIIINISIAKINFIILKPPFDTYHIIIDNYFCQSLFLIYFYTINYYVLTLLYIMDANCKKI